MAIEFDCPSCNSTIRVPDAYGGKQGRCPKCDTRLLVPTVLRPDNVAASASAATTNTVSSGGSTTDLPVAETFAVQTSTRTTRKRSARRRPSRALVIGMPVLGFLVLLAIIGFAVTSSLPELNGELAATRIEATSLPKVMIPWADTGLSEDEQKTLGDFLTTTPETLSSQVMTCRLIGAAEGIEVQLTAGSTHEWCMVQTANNKPLALWLKRERPALNAKRIQILRAALANYCRDKLTQIAGEPVSINVIAVRNDVGINACGDALSFVVEASTGNKQIPCSYEDDAGNIYFCVPRGTTSFAIQGRNLPDGSKPFAGEYTAVAASISRPAVEPTSATDSTEKPASKGDDSEEMPGSAEKNEDGMDPSGDEIQQDSTSEGKSKQKPTMNEPSMEMDSGMPMKMDEMSPPSNGKALFKDEDEMMPRAKMKGSKN